MSNFEELIAGDQPVLVDFYATWCGPCKMMHPILKEIGDRVRGRAHVVQVDVDQAQQLALELNVQAVPTLIIFKKGAVVWREAGVHDADTMVAALEKFM